MTRIIAGSAGGRRLSVPPGGRTRPTSDRAREALFSALESHRGPLAGARVLDLYAGSGAVGLEALSRGAAHAVFVEADPRALTTLRANIRELSLPGAQVVAGRVAPLVAAPPADRLPFDVAFLDPPYSVGPAELDPVVRDLLRHGWLTAGAVVVAERSRRDPPLAWPAGLVPLQQRRYGEGVLWYGRAPAHAAPESPA